MKMFVGRLPNGTTQEDLNKYFSQFGELTDTYIPTPFRNFAFLTYASTEDGRACLRENHVLDVSIFISFIFIKKNYELYEGAKI